MDEGKNLVVERLDRVAVVTVSRPKALNALNVALLGELDRLMEELDGDEDTGAVVITGGGERAFVAGADIGEFTKLTPATAFAFGRRGQAVFSRIENLGKPVVAAVNGFALGGGLELAMACTMRVAAENARFGLPEVSLGAIPGYGGTQRLPRLVGKGRALEMILTAEMIDAAEAYRIGLVNKVVPLNQLRDAALDLARRMLKNSPLALRLAMRAVNGADPSLEGGLVHEANLLGLAVASEDMQEGVQAFLAKRKPSFKGR